MPVLNSTANDINNAIMLRQFADVALKGAHLSKVRDAVLLPLNVIREYAANKQDVDDLRRRRPNAVHFWAKFPERILAKEIAHRRDIPAAVAQKLVPDCKMLLSGELKTVDGEVKMTYRMHGASRRYVLCSYDPNGSDITELLKKVA